MAKTKTSQRDEKHELTRRALIKWSVAAGAALGVSRSKIYEILEKTAGKGVAYAASESLTTRSIHLIAGNGGLAHFMLLWPHYDVARANNPNFAWQHPGASIEVAGTDRPLVIGADTPGASLAPQRQMTAFVCGNDETHTNTPLSTTTLNGAGIFSVASALQAGAPSVVPLVTVGNAQAGTAPGGAAAANVASADGFVALFNSAASRAGGLLSKSTDAALYKAHYDAFIQLNRAANRSTTHASYTTASGAAQFLGTNLAAKLAVGPDDLTRYGITGTTRANVTAIGRTFIVAAKAFSLGLTNAVVLPAMSDDPHGLWDSGDEKVVPPQLKGIFDGLLGDLTRLVDANTQQALIDDTVITISGDTTKNPLVRPGWPDGGVKGSNVTFVYGAGHLMSGWNGMADRGGNVTGFGTDGKPAAYDKVLTSKIATASIAYAIAKRDDRAISTFANGVTVGGVFGRLKDK
jgi:hypothetical protein